jgi:Arc/MetJ family transcription regulator
MRINIDLDDELLEEAMRHSSARTKRALVEEALQTFVDVKTAELRRSSYKDRLASIRSRTTSLRLTKRTAEILGEDRSRS